MSQTFPKDRGRLHIMDNAPAGLAYVRSQYLPRATSAYVEEGLLEGRSLLPHTSG